MSDEIDDFEDNDFADEVYAISRTPDEPRVKVRALSDYCKAKGIKPKDLTEKELEQFLER